MDKRQNSLFSVYLGKEKTTHEPQKVFLRGFEWECNWYWAGGYIVTNNMHAHFDGCFLDIVDVRGHILGDFVSPWNKNKSENSKEIINGCSVWEDLDFFLDDPQFTSDEWWRIKDLYKQFYIFRDASEAFQYGGHCGGKNSEGEINKEKAKEINDHIETVIIPQIKIALKV